MRIPTSKACLALAISVSLLGCASTDIPQAHRGRMFDRTGPLALWIGGNGFTGPVLGPGTYYVGTYNEVYMVDCSMMTVKEPLQALTRDGVQFGLDVYVRFGADCSDQTVVQLLSTITPDRDHTISAGRLYEWLVKPSVNEAVRETVSPVRANDLNEKREELLSEIRKRIVDLMTQKEKNVVRVYEVNLTNLDFPDAMDQANVDRAVQGVLRDKAIAERERVTAEIETMKMRRELALQESEVGAARIEKVGAALRQYPEYLQYDLQTKMPEIYKEAGIRGNLVLAAPNPMTSAPVIVSPRGPAPAPAPAGTAEH
jgi:regulator of protease activity HflC (stomatin/prohibitin superfamily)